jgi:predicted glycosyltransferase
MRRRFFVSRPALLLYSQHSLGLGHAVRSFALAAALVKHFRVVVACGGELPDSLSPPDDVELVVLPALGASRDGRLVSRGRFSLDAARRRRRRLLLDTFRTLSPRVLVIELFPFGRRKFADELVPLLEAAAAAAPRVLVVSSVRDILVGRQPDQQAHDTLSCVLANRYFDAALVHSDPRFARLEESFRPSIPLQVPVFHTGFVVPDKNGHSGSPAREPRVVVSAGGGLVGEPLLRAALEARPLLPENLRLDLVAGPFLPEEAWSSLEASARAVEGVQLRRFVADLTGELSTASASVSQCGYNTALDLLRARVPALVVPYSEGREDEQTRRARRLERLGAVRVLEPERLDASSFAREIQELLRFRPRPLDLDVDGARASARLLARLTGAGLPLREKATAV